MIYVSVEVTHLCDFIKMALKSQSDFKRVSLKNKYIKIAELTVKNYTTHNSKDQAN